MTFVFIHGSFSTPDDAWFPWLKKELEKYGHKVISPQFPVDKWSDVGNLKTSDYKPTQNLNGWFMVFDKIYKENLKNDSLFFVTHSIGPLFTLEVAEKYSIKIDHAVFIAPFFEIYGKSEIVEKANATFYKKDFNFEKLQKLISDSTVLYSDDDPYVDEKKAIDFAKKMNSKTIRLSGLGHMGIESNLKKFPQLLKIILEML
jgi:predicted alpha/beta hydrolase family esterase